MSFFQNFTHSIKQKWLQFFQTNRDWITLHMAVESVYTPDGGKRPSSYLILGVVNALEPTLAQLMLPFAKLNCDPDILIEVLELHFDPDIALGNRLSPGVEPGFQSNDLATDPENDFLSQSLVSPEFNGFGEEAVAGTLNGLDASNELNTEPEEVPSEFEQISLTSDFGSDDSEAIHHLETAADKLDDFTFDTETLTGEILDESGLDDLNTSPDENSFRDVVSDVWGDESSQTLGGGNGNLLGEELPAEVFDDAEIARLFPNS
jgi:hypothetical protein